jgi:guanosine-3',5'-bis(diphosphate) 3'-pyrophosphohydrolase
MSTDAAPVPTDPLEDPALDQALDQAEEQIHRASDVAGGYDASLPPQFRRPATVEQLLPDTAPPRRMAARALARIGGRKSIPKEIEPLVRAMRTHHPKVEMGGMIRAFEIAEDAHRGQLRRSGEPYITHPVAVAQILADLGMDEATVIAALLHDTVEDTPLELKAVSEEFGDLVALVVDGVTKLDRVKVDSALEREAETVRKMVVAMARDPRVLVVKLADRLHNMRTLRWLPEDKQERKSRETLEIYAPLAHRLGLNTIKWELEDLAFATLYPQRYDEIVRLVAARAPSRDTYLREVTGQVEGAISGSKIKAQVNGRPKHYYSIYQKMIVRSREFDDIHDLVGVRIVVDSVRDCYAVLGLLHAKWNPIPGRFKDYIAMPKLSMYQSLHTTVVGPEGKPVELQIRSEAMHRVAEYGIAAHWRYKESGSKRTDVTGAPETAGEMAWLRQIVDWQRETADPGEFLEALRFDLHSREVFVFTPKGDVVALPQGATAVDFAYSVHTEVGHRCIGARVNGRLVALESELTNGDTVEVLTSKAGTAGPSRDWLTFVASPRAKTKIRQWFAKERREDAIEAGKEAIARTMRRLGLPLQRLMTGDTMSTLASDLHFADVSALMAAVGEGHLSAGTVVSRVVTSLGGAEGATEALAETALPTRPRPRADSDPGVVVDGLALGDVVVRLSRCCTPVPGDAISGFVTRGHGVSVHRSDCVNVPALQETGRTIGVRWSPGPASVFLVNVQVEALDRKGLLSDVTKVLSEHHVNILSAAVNTGRDRTALSRFTFEMGSTAHLGHLLSAVRGIEGVYDCYRVVSRSPDDSSGDSAVQRAADSPTTD